jgi:hypothetical protein
MVYQEQFYLKEWLDYHLSLPVSVIYLTLDREKIDDYDFLEKYTKQGSVEIIPKIE